LRLAGLGIFVGIFAGLIVTLFRFILESSLPFFADGISAENFEALHPGVRFILPITGCLLIALLFQWLKPKREELGVTYVINKVQNFRGHLPVRHAVSQFIGASLALLSGGSCGREGPAIHLGATSGSVLGYWLNLPHNSIRTLIACGAAAAISASFNTPIAGVIFAMEVIMMEYAISSFVPVIISSVSAAVVTQILFGNDPVFDISVTQTSSLWEIPYIALMGIVIGLLAFVFVRVYRFASGFNRIDQRIRLLGIGLLTACTGWFIPQVMGMGYDTLNLALQSSLALNFLGLLLITKLLLTAVSLGLGLPGGIIGPVLMLGGIAGAILGALVGQFFPGSDPAFYVLLGMGAMMGATLQAPLAALMALLELSNNPNIILPAMIIIVIATLTYSEVLKSKSVFLQQDESGTGSRDFSRFLNRYGVSSLVKQNFAVINPDINIMELDAIMQADPYWLILEHADNTKSLIRKSELENLGDISPDLLQNESRQEDLLAIPDKATLNEALQLLQEAELKYGYIYTHNRSASPITGIISIDDIIAFYRD